ncbi:hypothetical protein FX988_02333 [Paraglaciecola mesophila]|uniref:Membrane transport protein MMPL domain-containing protein n=1 Tax=Paraglaciecola mesophila TaxID=197222 RepID=A0A857JM83_9ALTE|nr:MMPL family transporter [Paraglaciecola mesophila]QHJ12087.1 hypothetical protein FX988_02333 [Paraglaciecola mesophila]
MTSTLKKVALPLWLLLLATLYFCAFSQAPKFDSSIMSLLPHSQQQPTVQTAIDKTSASFSNQMLLLVTGDNDLQIQQTLPNVAKAFQSLNQVDKVQWRVDDDFLARFHQELFPYRFALLNSESRQALKDKQFDQFEQRTLAKVFSPLSTDKLDLIEDPFGFFSNLSQQQKSSVNIQFVQSLLKVRNTAQPTYLILLTLSGDPYSLDVQKSVIDTLKTQQKQLKDIGLTLHASGMILHADAGAKQAKHEISSIGFGSLMGIVLVLLLVFRQVPPIILMLLPVAVGCITAIAATILLFGKVHLITLAFGAGLVGVSIDYALHFISERRYNSAQKCLPSILPGLVLGLISSVLAYSVQIFAPFPGLQQMAVFSVVGLISSWLTVVLLLPVLTRRSVEKPIPIATVLSAWRTKVPRFKLNIVTSTLLISFVSGSLFFIANGNVQDDVRLLQTSPPSLLEQEKQIQQMLGTSSSTQFILITCDSLDICIENETSLTEQLLPLVSNNTLPPFQALSEHLSSNQAQVQNYQLVSQLYRANLPSLYTKLGLNESQQQKAKFAFEQAKTNQLSAEKWQELEVNEGWRDLIISSEDNNSATVIRFMGYLNSKAKHQLENIISAFPNAQLIDQVANISNVLQTYRVQISQLVLAAYLAVLLLLTWRYRMDVWRVVTPPILASLFTLSAVTLIEGGVNIFHLLGLILVLGIGLDMGIFMTESTSNEQTWLAVSLSSLTSLLAFGLLAWSQTPVLHHFGLTVLIGLSLVWLMTPTMCRHDE